jgi:Protein of unknown function (DUF2789)
METSYHHFCELFAQLGLPADEPSVRAFISSHRPLPGTVRLADAPFWNAAQARLLREGTSDDADWSAVVDQLNAALR